MVLLTDLTTLLSADYFVSWPKSYCSFHINSLHPSNIFLSAVALLKMECYFTYRQKYCYSCPVFVFRCFLLMAMLSGCGPWLTRWCVPSPCGPRWSAARHCCSLSRRREGQTCHQSSSLSPRRRYSAKHSSGEQDGSSYARHFI